MDQLINKTKNWIDQFVIGLNLCPFAKAVYDKDQIRYTVNESESNDELLISFYNELLLLKKIGPKDAATGFYIFPNAFSDFESFLDFYAQAEFVLKESKLEQTFQLAGFHPKYLFAESAEEDIENATNRSPYPMIHILRVKQVSKAIDTYPDVSAIPENNIETLKELGPDGVKNIFDQL